MVAPTDPPTARGPIIGLTGGIGSGKTTVANAFAAKGAALVDTDHIARQLTSTGGAALPAIRAAFGEDVIDVSGALDRAAMRQRVFTDASTKARLEGILHPMIRAACAEALAQFDAPYALLVVPLLVETGHYLPWCERVLVVDCDEETQIRRVMQRSGLARDEVCRIMASQCSRSARLAAADDLIDNGGPPENLAPQVNMLHERYVRLPRAQNQIS